MNDPSTSPVLIFGASSNIAEAIAQKFAMQGHALQLVGRDIEYLRVAARDLHLRYNVGVTYHYLDALDVDVHRKFLHDISPKPCIVICAVGLLGNQTSLQHNVTEAELVMRTNYIGPSLFMEAAAEILSELDTPTALIGISSVAGDRGRAKNYYYGSAKAGFTQFLSGLRQRLYGSQVHVMTVKPGFVATRMTKDLDLPSSLTVSPHDVADLVWRSLKSRRHIVYDWKWRLIMMLIGALPENVFRRTKF